MKDRLEYKMRGAWVSMFCEPKNVDASWTDSLDRLAASWIASWFDIECKNVKVIVISEQACQKKK